MEKNYPLVVEILKRMQRAGILDHVLLVGSWCAYLYKIYFAPRRYEPAIRTTDIDFALSKQFDYSYLSPTDSSLSASLVAAYKPFSRVGENLRAVRSQLMLRWFNGDPLHKILAVVSAGNWPAV